ncbi:MAG: hypothetical protein KJ726_05820, partial [Verrucomicrobia bacterium]|nr:hypothetical protein [Verrucomicrobiota bacterium]
PPAEVEEEPGATRKQAVSLYTGLNLVVVGQEKTWPMKLTKDFQWEGRAEFQNLENAELKIAVAEGSLFWGAADDWAVPVPHRGILKRRGGHIRVEGVLDGAYRVRFNEDTLVFSIEPAGVGDGPAGFRTWTSVSDNQVQARLLSVRGGWVILERPTGQKVQVSLEGLSETDRAYLQSVADDR